MYVVSYFHILMVKNLNLRYSFLTRVLVNNLHGVRSPTLFDLLKLVLYL